MPRTRKVFAHPSICLAGLVALVCTSFSAQQSLSHRKPRIRPLSVVAVSPAPISTALPATTITVSFDRPVLASTVNSSSFRVWGRWTGTASGTYLLAQGGREVTFVPNEPFSAGELVTVNISHDVAASSGEHLRAAGFCYQFSAAVRLTPGIFTSASIMSNNEGEQTRIYGASVADLDNDGFLDITTVNEISADLRVFMNLGDGTGSFSPYLTPTPIGSEASPNEPADFDNDGNSDLCVAAAGSNSVWILLGAGDGTFDSTQEIPVGIDPHGIAAIDVDGDGDLDVVNCNRVSNDMSLMLNDGTGTFGGATFFDGGVNGEYGLATGDIDRDGILDLVVAGRTGAHLVTLFGTGGGSFVQAAPATSTGGPTWVVVLGDVNGDGFLDAASANSYVGNGSIVLGNGDGTFGVPTIQDVGAHTSASDLADLDGDGDLDWILSSFGGGYWLLYRNDGAGNFTNWHQIWAAANPSCAVPFDFDNDGDLDLALSDEIADVVLLMENL